MVDIAGLSQQWDQRWPGCSKVPYLLRGLKDRWVRFHTAAKYWSSACIDDEPDSTSWIHLYLSETPWATGSLDPLLHRVADDVIANVLITDVALRWLYHLYDGGMDVILPTTAERDALRRRHSEWLSEHPTGL